MSGMAHFAACPRRRTLSPCSTSFAAGYIVQVRWELRHRQMKSGLYSVHIHMLDGVKGRDSGALILRDGAFLGGGPYFWSTGSYTFADGTWKGHLRTNQHTPFTDPFVRVRCSAGRKSPAGFRERLPTTGPKCSAPRWWEREA